MKTINFEKITLRQQITSRGGGMEISLDTLGFKGEKMAAYVLITQYKPIISLVLMPKKLNWKR